jgi:hypothetical protein
MDEIDLLRKFQEGFPDPDREQIARARLAVTRGVAAPPPFRAPQAPRTRRRWAIATALATVSAALVLALPAIIPNGAPGGPQTAAARVLSHAALVAARQPTDPQPQPGQYVHTKSKSFGTMLWIPGRGNANFFTTVPMTREAWIGPDGSGRIVTVEGEPTFPTPGDSAAWKASGMSLFRARSTDETFKPGELHYLDLANLPTDPVELGTLIENRKIEGGPPGDWETFAIIGDLLSETYTHPELRSALYQVVADLPGVELVGDVKDPIGRDGVAVAYTHAGARAELIFDPDTSQLLAEQEVMVDPVAYGVDIASEPGNTGVAYAPPGKVIYSVVYLASGVVDNTSTSSVT